MHIRSAMILFEESPVANENVLVLQKRKSPLISLFIVFLIIHIP
jgi:hypothetical protein